MELHQSEDATKKLPSELAGSPPRRVQVNLSDDAKYLVTVVVLFLIGGSIGLAWTLTCDVTQIIHRNALRGNYSVVVGEVTGFTFGRYSPKAVNYRFTVNGASYMGQAIDLPPFSAR